MHYQKRPNKLIKKSLLLEKWADYCFCFVLFVGCKEPTVKPALKKERWEWVKIFYCQFKSTINRLIIHRFKSSDTTWYVFVCIPIRLVSGDENM